MTAACGGGASGPLPGTSAVISLTAVPVEAFAADAGAPPPVAAAIGAAVAAAADIVTANFCATDPPPDPGLQPSDLVNILNPGNFQAYLQSSQNVTNWFLHHYWYLVCGCTGAPAPTAPTVTLPTPPGTNTNLPTGQASGPCWSAQMATTIPFLGTGANTSINVTSSLIPTTTAVPVTPPASISTATTAQTIPNGVTQVQMLGLSNYPNNAAEPIFIACNCYDSSGTLIVPSGQSGTTHATRLNNHPTFVVIETWSLPPGAVSIQAVLSQHTALANQDVQAGINFLCGTGQTVVQPCCPPDPTVEQYLNLILQIVSNLHNAAAPSTSWRPGVSHAGLSGQGSFQLATGVTAVRADFTTIPAAIRVTPGTPTFYWDLGFVTPVAIDVPLRSLRTVFATQDMPLPPQATAVDYTFPPGVAVTLTELLPA